MVRYLWMGNTSKFGAMTNYKGNTVKNVIVFMSDILLKNKEYEVSSDKEVTFV